MTPRMEHKQFETLMLAITGLKTEMNARFTDLETRMNARFDAVDARFDRVEGELKVIRDQAAHVTERVSHLESPQEPKGKA